MSSVSAPATARRRRRGPLVVGVVAGLVLACLIGSLYLRMTTPPDPPAVSHDGLDPEAVATLDEARAEVLKSPRSAAAWAKLGMIYFAFGYKDESGICLHWAGVREPKNPVWPYLEALTALDEPDRCLPLLAKAVELDPDEPVMRLKHGEMLLEQGRPDDAEAEFSRVLEQDPDDSRAHLGLGRICYQRGEFAAARDHLERSAERASRVRATHALLAEIYQRLNDPAGVEREQKRMAESIEGQVWYDPYELEVDQYRVGGQARIEEAELAFKNGDTKKAITTLTRFLHDHPDSQPAHVSLAGMLVRLDDDAGAEKELRTAVRLKPDVVNVQCDLGWLLQRHGKYAEAADHYRQAIHTKPMHATAHYALANCLHHLGKNADAMKSYGDATRCKPDFADAHRELGRLLAESGDTVAARKELALAVKLAPSDDAARKLLEELPE